VELEDRPLEFFVNFDELLEIGMSELRSTRFHYVLSGHINDAEGFLITRLKERERATGGDGRRFIFGKSRLEPFDRTARVIQCFAQLGEPEAERGALAYILG
jgi:hypothetical protein